MVDKDFENIMVQFILRHYPIVRIKHNNRFKRGIILDSGLEYLLINSNTHLVKEKLLAILKTVFNCDDSVAYDVLKKTINL